MITVVSPADAFTLFYGLIIQDRQIRTLLGETPPTIAQRRHAARTAVQRFLALTEPGSAD